MTKEGPRQICKSLDIIVQLNHQMKQQQGVL